jgi:hypothetical protein
MYKTVFSVAALVVVVAAAEGVVRMVLNGLAEDADREWGRHLSGCPGILPGPDVTKLFMAVSYEFSQ